MTAGTDPYAEFAGLRAQPVVPADVQQMFALADGDPDFLAGLPPIYAVTTYDAVQEVLRDGRRFSSSGYAEVIGPVMGTTILEMDEPEHTAYRALLQQAFTRRAMARWERELVTPTVDGLIDRFADEGRAELVDRLTFPFPINVIAAMLGLDSSELPQFHRWAAELIDVGGDLARAMAAARSLGDHLLALVQQRRTTPGDDLISALAHAEYDGHRLADEEILAFCRLLLPAGAETTYRSSSNLLCGLLTHPEQLAAVQADRSLLPQAIEEGMRWECPLLTIMRLVRIDTEVADVPVPAGAVLVVHLGSANRDESRWENAQAFDIFRPQRPHAAFAAGAHTCLGIHLARMETRVLLDRLLDRLRELRLDPDAEPPTIRGVALRAPLSLPVVFRSAA